MRTVFYVALLITIGILTSLFVGFDFSQSSGQLDYDDEQEGLAEEVKIRFSHVYAENTPQGQAARYFAKRVEEKTNQKIKVEIYPNGVLYNNEEELKALENGNVQMIAPSTSDLANTYPKFRVLDLPFVYTNINKINAAYEGKIGIHLMEEFERSPVKALDFWFSGYKQITSNSQFMKTPANFDKKHFGVMDSPLIKEQFNRFGASTTGMSMNKLYRNLDVNFIEGQENTVSNIYTRKLYQVQDYMTVSNHGIMSNLVMINREFWEKLTPELQVILSECLSETTNWEIRHAIEINDQQLRSLKRDELIQVHLLTKSERKAWRTALRPLYVDLDSTIGRDLMEEINGLRSQ